MSDLNSLSSTVVIKPGDQAIAKFNHDLFAVCYYQNIKINIQRIHEWAKYIDRMAILIAR